MFINLVIDKKSHIGSWYTVQIMQKEYCGLSKGKKDTHIIRYVHVKIVTKKASE